MERLLMKNTMVSIIIPAYNASNYLSDAIESALGQTYNNIEIIVVNDGSTDEGKTEKIALSYGKQIRYYRKENGGVASALNYGIREMKGEYFSWLSHDDLYMPNKVEKQIQCLQKCGDDTRLVFSKSDFKIENEPQILENTDMISYPKEELERGIFPVLCNMVNGCTVLIHKSHFQRTGLFDERLQTTQDYDMWLRLFAGQKSMYIPEALVVQRLHPEQGSRTIKEFETDCNALYKKMLRVIKEDRIDLDDVRKYCFVSNFIYLSEVRGWEELSIECKEYLKQLKIPFDLEYRKKKLVDQFFLDVDRVFIYCAGENGRRLWAELKARKIKVEAFVDNDSRKWGTMIDGLPCIMPDKLRVTDTVIISKEAPGDIYKELVKKGFMHVTTYDKMRFALYAAPTE